MTNLQILVINQFPFLSEIKKMIFSSYIRPLNLVTILVTINLISAEQKAKSVTTLVDAKWEVTPLVLEVAEYIGDESVDDYWSYIDDISHLNPQLIELESDKLQYEKSLEVINNSCN